MSDTPTPGVGDEAELPPTQPVDFEPRTGRHASPPPSAEPPAPQPAVPQPPAPTLAFGAGAPGQDGLEQDGLDQDGLDELFGGFDEPDAVDQHRPATTVTAAAEPSPTMVYPTGADPLAWLESEPGAAGGGTVTDPAFSQALTQRFDASPSTTATAAARLDAAGGGPGGPGSPDRRLIIGLVAAGAALLVLVLVLVLVAVLRGGGSTAAQSDTPSDTSSASDDASASTTDSTSPTPTDTDTDTDSATPTSTALPAPVISGFTVASSANVVPNGTGAQVNCSSSGQTVPINFNWSTSNGADVFFGVNTADASSSPKFSNLPAAGSLPANAIMFSCSANSMQYTLTVLTADGQKISKSLTVYPNLVTPTATTSAGTPSGPAS